MRKSKQNFERVVLTNILATVALCVSVAAGQSVANDAECRVLDSKPAILEIEAEKVHCYRLKIEKDSFLRVRAEQNGVDVAVSLVDSSGNVVSEVDSPNGGYGQEFLYAITTRSDDYTLQVKSTESKRSGPYTIRLEILRPASETDRQLMKGIATFVEAQKTQDPQTALNRYRSALSDFKAADDRFQEALALGQIGAIFFNSAQYDEALANFEPAVGSLANDYVAERAAVIDWMGKCRLRQSKFDLALEDFKAALTLFKSIGHLQGEAQTLSNIGLLYLDSGQKQQALKNFEGALKIATDNGFRTDEAAFYNNIGRAHDELGDLEKAVKNFELALERVNNNTERGYVLLSLGKAKLDVKDAKGALAQFEESRELLKGVDAFAETAGINGIGRAQSDLNNKELAGEMYFSALRNFRYFGSKRGEARVFGNLMALTQKIGNRPLAIFFGKQAINAYQQVRSSTRRIDNESQRAFIADVADTYRMLAALLMEEEGGERVGEALEVLGLLKEEEFSRFTRFSKKVSTPVLQLGFVGHEATASRDYNALHDRFLRLNQRTAELRREAGALSRNGQTVSAEKQDELLKLQSDLVENDNQFVQLLKSLSVSFRKSNGMGAETIPDPLARAWQKRLKELGSETVLLTTLMRNDRYYAVLTTHASHIVRSSKTDRGALEQKIELFRRKLEDPQTLTEHLGLSRQLYESLIKPVAADLERLGAKTILLSLDGELRYVPFATLNDGKRYLVEKYATNVVTLAQPTSRGKQSVETWRALVAGVSKDPNEPLPRVAAELNFLVPDSAVKVSATGAFRGSKLLDRNFSLANFLTELARKPDLVHIASHFTLSRGDMSSYLLLGNGEKLRLSDLRDESDNRFDMSSIELLTLSACETGSKEMNDSNGVEIENLSVIVRKRGAKSVLATLWLVADDSAPELMRHFYGRYKAARGRISKAEALRAAQIAMLKDSKYDHPAHWGAFIGMGEL